MPETSTMFGNGVTIALVKSLEDPEKLGRVCVTYPRLDEKESHWARLVSPMAGANRGIFFRPEVGDEVLVVWELGDPRQPYVLGSLWSKVDKHPKDDGKPKENNWRFIKSRSGHLIKLDDTKSKEKIEVLDMAGKRRLVLDVSEKKIQIECDDGDIEVSAPKGSVKVKANKVEASAAGEISVTGKEVKVHGESSVSVTSGGAMTLEASTAMTIKGKTVDIN